MRELTDEARTALDPVRRWLLDQAGRDVEAVLGTARAEAGTRVAAARTERDALLERARREGADQAAATIARAVAAARRQARSVVLVATAQEQVATREAVLAAASHLRQDPGYPALLERLTRSARAALGDDAQVAEAAAGGVEGHSPTRRVDLTLPTLAAQVLTGRAGGGPGGGPGGGGTGGGATDGGATDGGGSDVGHG